VSQSPPLTPACALGNALPSLIFQDKTSLNWDRSEHRRLQRRAKAFREASNRNRTEIRKFALESMLRKSKHLEIPEQISSTCKQPQLQPHWTVLLLSPPCSLQTLGLICTSLGSPRAPCCPVHHSWAARGLHVPGCSLSVVSFSLDSCRRWQTASTQRTSCASDLGGFIAACCFSLLKMRLYFLLHDPGGWYRSSREVILV